MTETRPGNPLRRIEARCHALLRLHPSAFVSHITAAQLWGAPIDAVHTLPGIVDLAVAAPDRAPSAVGVRSHRIAIDPVDIVEHRGLPIASPARTWVDSASLLPLRVLIAVGGAFVRGDAPLTTYPELVAKAEAHPPHKSRTKLLHALVSISVGQH